MRKRAKLRTTIRVVEPAKQLKNARTIIEKFRDKNHIKFNRLYIKLDYSDPDLGHYWYNNKVKSCVLYVNPEQCYKREKEGYKGHPDDVSLQSVVIHEFSHFIDDILGIEKHYRKQTFTKPKFYINNWSKANKVEEIAEMICLFLLNPYLLKLIDNERFNFLKNKMKLKPVVPCTEKSFFRIYKEWCPTAKKHVKHRFHLIINEKKNIVRMRKYIPLKDINKYTRMR